MHARQSLHKHMQSAMLANQPYAPGSQQCCSAGYAKCRLCKVQMQSRCVSGHTQTCSGRQAHMGSIRRSYGNITTKQQQQLLKQGPGHTCWVCQETKRAAPFIETADTDAPAALAADPFAPPGCTSRVNTHKDGCHPPRWTPECRRRLLHRCNAHGACWHQCWRPYGCKSVVGSHARPRPKACTGCLLVQHVGR
jgi:hypothetical protein